MSGKKAGLKDWEARFAKFGGVTEEVLFDNARALVVDHDPTTRTVVFNDKLKSIRQALGLPTACLRTIPCPHQGQDRERRRLREAQRDRRQVLPDLGSF